MSAQFQHKVGSGVREHGVALYYEDEKVALNTWKSYPTGHTSYHEVMLDHDAVRLLIAALTTMQANINERFPKETQP